MGRFICTGNWNLDVTDGKYREESENLDSTGPIATCVFRLQMNGAAVASGMGTCGFVGQIGVYTGWLNDIAEGTKAAITGMDWLGMVLICFVLPALLSVLFAIPLRKCGWIKEDDLKLDL